MMEIERCEQALALSVGRRHAVLVGSGTTALMLACQLIASDKRKVIIPANACANVMFAVLYANKIPVVVDVRLQDATLDPKKVGEILAADSDVGAVIAVHLYGHRADLGALATLTKPRGILLIEDACQAHGGIHPDGHMFGALGDLSIISFGHTKILDVGGGGVLLYDDSNMVDHIRNNLAQLQPAPVNATILQTIYSRLFYAFLEAYRTDAKFAILFNQLPDLFKNLFICTSTALQAKKIYEALPDLIHEIKHRRDLYTEYYNILKTIDGVDLFDIDVAAIAPWRFTFRVPAVIRDQLLNVLRAGGYHASSWYPCIAEWDRSGQHSAKPDVSVARSLEFQVVNLWISRDQKKAEVQKLANEIVMFFYNLKK